MSVENLNSQSRHTLADWLCYIEQSHPIDKIEMGLERVKRVADRGNLTLLPGKVVLVAGTNGKGTTLRTLEQVLLAQGHTVGVYTSPHLQNFNERLRLNGQDVADADWLDAFALVDALRQDTSLTYFEFTTLVAFAILQAHSPEYCLIEVGLGGRLDATNIIEPDVSVITTIGLDHQDWLGHDVESISREKAGVFRTGKVAISGEVEPPQAILAVALEKGANLLQVGQHFHYHQALDNWHWQGVSSSYANLPLPRVPVQNVATSLAVLEQLGKLPSEALLHACLTQLRLPGRMQFVQQQPDVLLDVAHNPQSAAYLASQLQIIKPRYNKIIALVGMLKDKDVTQTLAPLTACIDEWHLASLPGTRGANNLLLVEALSLASSGNLLAVQQHDSMQIAYPAIMQSLQPSTLLVVFGSFITVSAVLAMRQE